jgi:hypothetical protein
MKNKLFKTMIAFMLVLLLSTTGVFAAVPDDVKGQAYEAAVSELMDKWIITGDTDGNFNPDSTLTRAQACIIIVKSMNPPSSEVVGTATQPAPKSGFSDMSGYGWADGYIGYAVKHGVTKGYPDGTFKPGNKVTMNELITMVLRAAGYSDETLGGTWPSNYTGKAIELEILNNLPAPLPEYATKWMAAQVDYNTLDLIEKANPQKEEESPSQTTPEGVPDTSGMTYVKGSFNSSMTTFNGKTLADDVEIYTYGQEKSFSSTMTFSKKAADYRMDTVYKYKNVETPAFYQLENGKIVSMVIPKDVGFTGLAYVVINGTYTSTNAKGEKVTGLNTLAAGREIKWLCDKGLADIPEKTGGDSYLNGTVYEIRLDDGIVESIYKSTESHRGDVFDELSGTDFVEITDFDNNVVELSDGNKFEIKDNATVYVMDADDQTEYRVGKQSSIKAGNQIRIIDMSDDDEISGDIVVVLAD